MIKLTKIDDKTIAVNEDFIETISQAPDTIITMHSGRSYVVKENIDEIIERAKIYKQQCHQKPKKEN